MANPETPGKILFPVCEYLLFAGELLCDERCDI